MYLTITKKMKGEQIDTELSHEQQLEQLIKQEIRQGIRQFNIRRHYRYYKPLFVGLKKYSSEFLLYSPVFLLRRILLFLAAAYLYPYGSI